MPDIGQRQLGGHDKLAHYAGADGLRREKRAVGSKLSEGTPIPDELASRFKFCQAEIEAGRNDRGFFFLINR